MKKPKFQTLAEAIEAGEPSIADKITGEVFKDKGRQSFWVDIKGEFLVTQKVFTTISGEYVIIARQRTQKEEKARTNAIQKERGGKIKALRKRIEKNMALRGFILIAWGNPFQSDNDHFNWRFYPGTHAYYLPETGPRCVYQRNFRIIYEEDEMGLETIMTVKLPGTGWSRWSRRRIADALKNQPDDFILCAPIWLLTSIPDPRPRYLAGEE